jgi:hypothetical protein
VIGERRRFNYPPEFQTGPEYREHSGQVVLILRQLGPDEADVGDDLERLFEFQCDDGFKGHAFESELEVNNDN